ncbi:MAG: GIY-YIG nuclease family protein, partial [Bacteroidota bacterium]|nr:GIY-YIG nuclease family protein [Bacteroidota bacterium]
TENVARVYLIVVNGEIYKIGGSQDKKGMKGTLNIYQDGGVKGRPSIRSFGIWYFLFYTIAELKRKIEIYMIYQENFATQVKGLTGYHFVGNAAISYKLIEECCIMDFRQRENGEYPKWNIQEQGADWPTEIKTEHANITKNSVSNNSKRKTVKV